MTDLTNALPIEPGIYAGDSDTVWQLDREGDFHMLVDSDFERVPSNTWSPDQLEAYRPLLLLSVPQSPRVVDSAAELDALPVGAVLRGLGTYGGVWEVTDDEDLERYAGAAENNYNTGAILLEHYGPFELLWAPGS